ncbi:MAG: molybdate ABC transporter substrate-binding protein [Deltaproteobacteria bacterium]|nr:molybdate ABC transporter substrate-binding protein [Deltaproteobacteria bacterium]
MRTLACLVVALASTGAHAQTLTVLAAASLKQPLEASAPAFEKAHPDVKVVVSAAATGVLAKQIEAGAPADVFLPADSKSNDALAQKGLVVPDKAFARNTLVVAAPSASKLNATRVEDLKSESFKRIGIGRPVQVPAGDYAMESLEHAAIATDVRARLVPGESVTQVLTWIRKGDVDVGFVYASDAASAKSDVHVLFTVPEAMHTPIVYTAAVVKASKQPELARAYLEFLRGEIGQAALKTAGFLPP